MLRVIILAALACVSHCILAGCSSKNTDSPAQQPAKLVFQNQFGGSLNASSPHTWASVKDKLRIGMTLNELGSMFADDGTKMMTAALPEAKEFPLTIFLKDGDLIMRLALGDGNKVIDWKFEPLDK